MSDRFLRLLPCDIDDMYHEFQSSPKEDLRAALIGLDRKIGPLPEKYNNSRLKQIILSEMLHHDLGANHYDHFLTEPWSVKFYYTDLVTNTIRAWANSSPFVLDLCCGTGKGSLEIARTGIPVVGMDISGEMLSLFDSKCNVLGLNNVLLVQADATCPPVSRKSISFVQMIGGLHHIKDRKACLNNLINILKPNVGIMLLHEPLIHEGEHRMKLFNLLHYPLLLADAPRVIRAILRRLDFQQNPRTEEGGYKTPWERGFRLSEIRDLVIETGGEVVMLRGQGLFSCLELPTYIGSRLASMAYGLLVLIDRKLSEKGKLDRQGGALLLVAQKRC